MLSTASSTPRWAAARAVLGATSRRRPRRRGSTTSAAALRRRVAVGGPSVSEPDAHTYRNRWQSSVLDQLEGSDEQTQMARLLAAWRQLEEEQKQLSWSQLLEVFQRGFYCCYVTEWSLKQGKNQISELLFLYGNLFEATTLWRL